MEDKAQSRKTGAVLKLNAFQQGPFLFAEIQPHITTVVNHRSS